MRTAGTSAFVPGGGPVETRNRWNGRRCPKGGAPIAADAPSVFRSRPRCWSRTGGSKTTPSDPSALGYLTPTDYAKAWTTNHPELS